MPACFLTLRSIIPSTRALDLQTRINNSCGFEIFNVARLAILQESRANSLGLDRDHEEHHIDAHAVTQEGGVLQKATDCLLHLDALVVERPPCHDLLYLGLDVLNERKECLSTVKDKALRCQEAI